MFARDGLEALQSLEEHPHVDLVVADINMPRMDGLSLLAKLQESEDKKSTIIVSAYGDMSNIRTAMNRGAFDFLTKPIDFADLEATIMGTVNTLGIGTLVSLFTAVLVTSAILGTLARTRLLRRPSALGAHQKEGGGWKFDFMGKSRWFFSFSGVILAVGAIAIATLGLNFGIDFESGTRMTTPLERPAIAFTTTLKSAGYWTAYVTDNTGVGFSPPWAAYRRSVDHFVRRGGQYGGTSAGASDAPCGRHSRRCPAPRAGRCTARLAAGPRPAAIR